MGTIRPARAAVLLVTASALFGCTSRVARRGPTEHVRAVEPVAPVDTVDLNDLHLPRGAKPGMFATWSVEEGDEEPDAVVEETVACVGESEGVVTLETRRVRRNGSRVVLAGRVRADGTLVDAWRGPEGGVGSPVRVRDTSGQWREQVTETERMRKAVGLPAPKVSTSAASEWLVVPAGRIQCTRNVVEASLLLWRVRFTTWHAVTPLPLSQLVKIDAEAPGHRSGMTLIAYGLEGARPTLAIPGPSGVAPRATATERR